MPFKKIKTKDPTIDTWHNNVLITKKLRSKIPHVSDIGEKELRLSGGMLMSVPSVEIGLQIGSIQIPKICALVVDHGYHEILLGSGVFDQIFKERDEQDNGRKTDSKSDDPFRYSSKAKEDPSALSIELYPTKTSFSLHQFENTIKNQRIIYNITLIATKHIQVEGLSVSKIDQIIENDEGIPDDLSLKVSSIESGSIWISMKSGCQTALKYLGSLFTTGASAKLAEQLANAKNSEINAEISEETRNEVASQIRTEQEKLKAENIQQTYEIWRKELRAQLVFLDELINQSTNPDVAAKLKDQKNQAILQMAEQQMVPIVRNIPGSYVSIDNNIPALPSPRK
jgi:hypothetical protein